MSLQSVWKREEGRMLAKEDFMVIQARSTAAHWLNDESHPASDRSGLLGTISGLLKYKATSHRTSLSREVSGPDETMLPASALAVEDTSLGEHEVEHNAAAEGGAGIARPTRPASQTRGACRPPAVRGSWSESVPTCRGQRARHSGPGGVGGILGRHRSCRRNAVFRNSGCRAPDARPSVFCP